MEKQTLSSKAYNQIKDGIMSLEMEPGQLLIEEDLAEIMGMSRTPIRTAIQNLKQENLIEHIPGKGNCVKDLSLNYLIDIFEIREALEILSVKLATRNRTEENINKLGYLIERQRELSTCEEMDSIEFLDIDREIHKEIAIASKNELLEAVMLRVNEAYKRYLYYTNYDYRVTNVVKEHEEICKCIIEQNEARAVEIMENHINDVKLSIILDLRRR